MIAVVESCDIEFVVFSRFFSFLDSYNPQPFYFHEIDCLIDCLLNTYLNQCFHRNLEKFIKLDMVACMLVSSIPSSFRFLEES